MLVRDRMSTPVIAVKPETTVLEALRLMDKEDIRRLPVVEGWRLVGLVTWWALTRTRTPGALPAELLNEPVRNVMTTALVTVSPDTMLEHAAVLLRERRVGTLPVLEQGQLVGIITESDIFTAFLDLLGARRSGVRVTVRLDDMVTSLARAVDAVGRLGLLLRGLATVQSGNEDHAILTVDDQDPTRLIRALEEAGLVVVYAEVRATATA